MPNPIAHKKWKYDLHPSIRMVQSVIAGMKEKTGRSIEEWIKLTKKEARRKRMCRVAEDNARIGGELCFVDRGPRHGKK